MSSLRKLLKRFVGTEDFRSALRGICLIGLVLSVPLLCAFSDVLFGEFPLQNKVVLSGHFDHNAHRYVAPQGPWSTWEARLINGSMGFLAWLVVLMIGGAILVKVCDAIDDRRRKAGEEEKKDTASRF